ncbi:MAG TPA: hypothetical protein VN106_10170 [Sphingomicrobium sp.]|jgi:hypothetical protein|nr:hypothetical protein [Sphingomicrobium sp.]
MAPLFFRLLLALVVLYAFWRGSSDERQVAMICVAGTIVTHLVWSPLHQRFAGVETGVAAVDVAVLLGFLWVALRSERFWPLWIAGLQLTTIFGHIMKAIDSQLFSRAYGAALMFWSYPIVVILAIGTWRRHKRQLRSEPEGFAY